MKNVFACIVCLSCANAHALTEVVDGIEWTYSVSEGKASVGNGRYPGPSAIPITTEGAITIPLSLGGYPVTEIGSYAFVRCVELTSVTIPNGVTRIGNSAFSGCAGLTSVVIPDSVTSIEGSAFSGCTALVSVYIFDISAWCRISFDGESVWQSSSPNLYINNVLVTDLKLPDDTTSISKYAFSGWRGLMSIRMPDSIVSIGFGAFSKCTGLTRVTIPNGITKIEQSLFYDCRGLSSVTIPKGVTYIGKDAFRGCRELTEVVFQGDLPSGIDLSMMLDCMLNNSTAYMKWPRAYSANYIKAGYLKYFAGFTDEGNVPPVTITSEIRANDPTVLDAAYSVASEKSAVKIRALAFEDGERSFAKVVRPETFANDTDGNPTAQNIGDNVAANLTNALSWKVSEDWATRLAKVKFEVLACDGALLPMETTIIPESDRYGKMQISWNRHTNDRIFDALMWLYADKVAGLTLENGVLKAGGKTLANGTEIADGKAAAEFVYRNMGFDGVLSGDLLNYVNEETRLGLEPDGIRQYAYKMMGE